MIGPLTSDDCCISISILEGPAHLNSCGVFGVGGAEMITAVSAWKS